MQGSGEAIRENEDGARVLNTENLLSHYRHIRDEGRRKRAGCQICGEGLGGVFTDIEPAKEPEKEDEVVQSAGVDEEETSTPPSDSWWDR